ncbi:MAG: rhombosortase [Desulfobacteraceae bacterium]|nr:rhombosortase [Desulfobacteraceae bacterium]MBU4001218.1 rhombosortase [Pseudomonadota bacterium]
MNPNLLDKKWILPGAVSTLALTVFLSGSTGFSWFVYHRDSILNGQVWRLFTTHFVHTGFNHLVLNIVGLTLVFLVFGKGYSMRPWLLCLGVSMAGVSLGLLVFHPDLEWYAGFSGVLHGLMVMGIIGSIGERRPLGYFLLVAVFLKIVFEQLGSPSSGMAEFIQSPVIVDAHLYGAITGLLFGIQKMPPILKRKPHV